MTDLIENPEPKKGEKKSAFIQRCIPVVKKEHPDWADDKVQAVCYNIWNRKHKNEEMFSSEAQFMFVPTKQHKTLTLLNAENTDANGNKRMIAVIGDRFMNGGFLSKEVLEKSYKKWNGTLHDINHMGTSTGFFLMQSDITYFIGFHKNIQYNKETGEVSMELETEPSCKYYQAWEAYIKLCERAGKIPNVSVTYFAKRSWITASELPSNVPWKKAGYNKDDLVPILDEITPVCVSTVLQGKCNDKDGCGLRNEENENNENNENESENSCDCLTEKINAEIETKRQELIKWLKENENK